MKVNKDEDEELFERQKEVLDKIFELEKKYKNLLKNQTMMLLAKSSKTGNSSLLEQVEMIQDRINGKGSLIYLALAMMSVENSWMLTHLYLDEASQLDKKWYEKYFSKTTFYKRKKEAIREFINIYFNCPI
ncbi:hypothetical protein H9M94_02215 [Mycoplasma sp. Pen4]|uniref:MG284/MPN403 family protein n=1 Tax=Mycoplasma sp. Pen4 TaxID=640330 RepID=UPI0016543835|nr:hypothetical protein [Mycoplasma sp. Pen4]QNM93408.1 hypothetical protein H9M94_02215 [Mycoplasma sp. Pen4]